MLYEQKYLCNDIRQAMQQYMIGGQITPIKNRNNIITQYGSSV